MISDLPHSRSSLWQPNQSASRMTEAIGIIVLMTVLLSMNAVSILLRNWL